MLERNQVCEQKKRNRGREAGEKAPNKRVKDEKEMRGEEGAPSDNIPWLHFNEFETLMIKEERRAYNIQRNIGFFNSNKGFAQTEDNDLRKMWITWHYPARAILAVFMVDNGNQKACRLDFIDQKNVASEGGNGKPFLTFDIDGLRDPEMRVTVTGENKAEWSEENREDLIAYFKPYFLNCPTKKAVKNRFEQAEFAKAIEDVRLKSLNQRIHFIRQSAMFTRASYVFWINWSDEKTQDRALKLRFSVAPYVSWAFSERCILKQNYSESKMRPGNLQYYRLEVCESLKGDEKKQTHKKYKMLEVWFSLDAKVGEVYGIEKGRTLSGNAILHILNYLIPLLQIEKTYLYDAAVIEKLPLRVYLGLALGRTWYMPMFDVLDCSGWQSGWDSEVFISQRKATYVEDVQFLRQLPLIDLYQSPLLSYDPKVDKKDLLEKLYAHACKDNPKTLRQQAEALQKKENEKAEAQPKMTLGQLAYSLYQQSKERKEQGLSSELKMFAALLQSYDNPKEEDPKNAIDKAFTTLFKTRLFVKNAEKKADSLSIIPSRGGIPAKLA